MGSQRVGPDLVTEQLIHATIWMSNVNVRNDLGLLYPVSILWSYFEHSLLHIWDDI